MCGRCFSVVVSSCQALNSYPDADTRNKGKMSQRYETKSVACKKPWLVRVKWGRERWTPNPLPSFSVIRLVLSGVVCSPDIPGSELETVVQTTYPALRAAPLSRGDTSDSSCIHQTLSRDNSKPRLPWQPGAGDLSKC